MGSNTSLALSKGICNLLFRAKPELKSHNSNFCWLVSRKLRKSGRNRPSVVLAMVAVGESKMRQSSANFQPGLWTDHFLHVSPDYDMTLDAWQKEAASLKEKVREKLINLSEPKDGFAELLKMIDVIQRLGVAYHFEEEIQQAIDQIFNHHDHLDHEHEADDANLLLISTLRFRILREHGYTASSDVFTKLKGGKNGSLEDGLKSRDVQVLLSLYEASHLRVHGEDILDEALEFTKSKLQEMVPYLEPCLAKRVIYALSRPIHKTVPRVSAWNFLSFYQDDKLHDEVLLKFAKLDFNIVQKQHQQELSDVSRWWQSLEVEVNFPFARDRLVESYFVALGVLYEPQYGLARKFLAKIVAMITILDDLFDNTYGIHGELQLFAHAVERWDINGMDKLPEYMKKWFAALREMYDEMEQQLAKAGRSSAMHYAENIMKNTVIAFSEESKWRAEESKTPTIEEYLEIAPNTIAYPMFTVASFTGMGDIATNQAFNWLTDNPKMLRSASLICRVMNDIVSHEFEQQREHAPSAVECCMRQKGVSEEEARTQLNKQIEDAWKDINQTLIDPETTLPMPLLMRILNLARVADLFYKEEDGFTNPTKIQDYLFSLLLHPLQI